MSLTLIYEHPSSQEDKREIKAEIYNILLWNNLTTAGHQKVT